MNSNATNLFNAVKQGNSSGWQNAKKIMPAMDINELIKIISSVFEAKDNRTEAVINAAKTLAEKYKKPIDAYMNAFSEAFIENSLKQMENQNLSKLGTKQFAKKIVSTTKKVENAVIAYCHSEIDEIELITRLQQTGILEVSQAFIQAAGINIAEVKTQIQSALHDTKGASVLFISFTASAAAYKMLREALQEAALMHETRIEIEKECNESIAMMKQFRERMSSTVSDYLFIHTETFNAGVSAMDQAILEDDIDGFIRGNAMIQDILNYNVQFRTKDEFDALMYSDTVFIL